MGGRSISYVVPEIRVAHRGRGADCVRRATFQDPTIKHHGHAMRHREHHVHVVLDQQHGMIARQFAQQSGE